MKPNIKTTIILLGLMLVLSACNDINPQLVCNTGTEGITASFSRDTVRQSYDAGTTFPFVVDISNKGAYDSPVYVQISHNIDIINISPETILIEDPLSGKAPWNECRGDTRRILFNLTPKPLLSAVQNFNTDISLNACYEYKLDFNTTLCVHNNIGEINVLRDNCRYGDKNFGGGQGSPISFIKAEAPIYLPDGTVRIRFYLRNFRNGNIVASRLGGFENSCTQSTGNLSDFVKIEGYLDQYELTCNALTSAQGPPDYIQLRADPQRIVKDNVETILRDYYVECEASNVDLTSPREMSVNLRMEYYYRQIGIETRTINIRRV
jgi:hypothetical protein